MSTRRFLLSSLLSCITALTYTAAHAQSGSEWQQHVRYNMEVQLDTEQHRMKGRQRLTYFNNSPDTLRQVFYHLYYNAFHPQSMMAERNRHLPDPDPRIVPRIWELGPDEVGFHRIEWLAQDGRPVAFDVNDTVMRVELAEPILPGDSTVLTMAFESQVPLMTRRSGRDSREGIDYTMAQWYPKMAAYDERGWHADPYVGREFYAPYGTFDVRITLPAEYVIGGTGVLQNPDWIGHGYETGSAINAARPTDSLTWHFRAENVHDFAWSADPDYVHDRFTDALGYTYHVLYQPDVAETWGNVQSWLPQLLGHMSANFGRYPWPQFTVAQGGDGGMEYPMVTFVTGNRSAGSLRGTTGHELAHMWFYGAIGSNETDYAWMDEGFANFIAREAQAALHGQPRPQRHEVLLDIAAAQHYGYFEPLNTPSDWFETTAGYSTAAYSGGEMLLAVLGYIISEPVRDEFLRAYYRRFLFGHPTPEDVEAVAEDVSGMQLDWFFDQFLHTRIDVDYAVEEVETAPAAGGGLTATITLEREGDTVLPADVLLLLEDSVYKWVHVPTSEAQGHKPVPSEWTVTDRWPWTSPEFTFSVAVPEPVQAVYVDPVWRTPEMNRLDNAARLPVASRFLRAPEGNWGQYSIGYRPLAQYAEGYGVAVGAQARGRYLFGRHAARAMLKLWSEPLLDARLWDGIDFELSYGDVLPGSEARWRTEFSSQKHLSFIESAVSLERRLGRHPWLRPSSRRAEVTLLHQYGPSPRADAPYLMRRLLPHHTVSVVARLSAEDAHNGARLLLEFGSSLDSDFGQTRTATRLVLDAVRSAAVAPLRLNARLHIALGAGPLAGGKVQRLGLSTVEDAWRNDAYRSLAAAIGETFGSPAFVPLASAGPVAYATRGTPSGRHQLAGSIEAVLPAVSRNPWLSPLRLLAFSGIGKVWDRDVTAALDAGGPLRADAGVGATYNVAALEPLARWTAQSDVLSSLRLAVRVPFWASDPSFTSEPEPFALRWVLGIETGF